MNRDYAIFNRDPGGSHVWHSNATGLWEARRQLHELSKITPYECLAVHVATNEVVARANVRTKGGKIPWIFRVAYDQRLLQAQTGTLNLHGWQVTTAFGNEAAKALLSTPDDYNLFHDYSLFVIGYGAPDETRESMVAFLKQRYPGTPILAVNSPFGRQLTGAYYNVQPTGDQSFVQAIATALSAHGV